jgi:hypothetical protein
LIKKSAKQNAEEEISKDSSKKPKVARVGGSRNDIVDQLSDSRMYKLDSEDEKYSILPLKKIFKIFSSVFALSHLFSFVLGIKM